MNSIEIAIAGQKYILSGEETPEHLNEVSELVRRRVESIRKKNPGLSLQKATMLVAFDFASETIKQKRRQLDTRGAILNQAQKLLERVENEIESVGRVPAGRQ
ncbi:MAG: cell division protein ZapA [Deltaproteobacteria bacterium]|nr:cell division protein ZapA [Deltaproteobacteria bacterium]